MDDRYLRLREEPNRDRGLHDHRSFHDCCDHRQLNLDDRMKDALNDPGIRRGHRCEAHGHRGFRMKDVSHDLQCEAHDRRDHMKDALNDPGIHRGLREEPYRRDRSLDARRVSHKFLEHELQRMHPWRVERVGHRCLKRGILNDHRGRLPLA